MIQTKTTHEIDMVHGPILNLFFVIGLGMGTAGVAIATDISNGVSAFLVVLALCRENSCLKFEVKKMCIDREALGRIAKIGVPCGLQSVLFNISNVLIQSSVNSFGASTIAANTASINLEGFYGSTMNAVSTSVVSFISANRGAGAYSRFRKIIFCAAGWETA